MVVSGALGFPDLGACGPLFWHHGEYALLDSLVSAITAMESEHGHIVFEFLEFGLDLGDVGDAWRIPHLILKCVQV